MRVYVLYNNTDRRFHGSRPFLRLPAAKARATLTSKSLGKSFQVVEVQLDPVEGAGPDYPFFHARAERRLSLIHI